MATDFFLDLGTDYAGESKDAKHGGQIQLLSWSWGGAQHTTIGLTGGAGAGKASMQDFAITKTVDKATPKLLAAMTKGTHIAKGTLYSVKAGGGGGEYLKVEFDEMFVTSLQTAASSEDPSEMVSFAYNKVTLTYSTQGVDGNLENAGEWTYDVAANTTA
jgi:type VI secretion system secreted protein Hcp